MRVLSFGLFASLTAAALSTLGGCSGASGAGSIISSLPSSSGAPQSSRADGERGSSPELVVSHFDYPGAYLLNNGYQFKRNLRGLVDSQGVAFDSQGNIYVADFGEKAIEEYSHRSNKPKMAYTSGLVDPVSVAVDKSGDVFVADFNDDKHGVIDEYPQGVNTIIEQCAPRGFVHGVALDSAGDVFVSFNKNRGGIGKIAEYKGGLAGCSETVLGATVRFASGITVDKNGVLVVCDEFDAVDIIPPPYSKIRSTITGVGVPLNVALNGENSLLYVADIHDEDLLVFDYPSGTPVTVITGADPAGVAAYPI
jgi:hypothetical protein